MILKDFLDVPGDNMVKHGNKPTLYSPWRSNSLPYTVIYVILLFLYNIVYIYRHISIRCYWLLCYFELFIKFRRGLIIMQCYKF